MGKVFNTRKKKTKYKEATSQATLIPNDYCTDEYK